MLIIGITGLLGAGKTTVADYLVNNKKFKLFSVGDYLASELKRKGKRADRPSLKKIANEIRNKKGAEYITKTLFKVASQLGQNSIIESIRNPEEAKFIKSRGGILLAVAAPQKTRYKRITKRASDRDKVTFREFKKQENEELNRSSANEQNLLGCIKISDYKITNSSSLAALYKKVDKIIESKKEKYVRPSWDDYFMEVANAIARRGTCDRGRSGCIIAKDKQVLATGYVGSPVGFPHCDDVGHDLRKTLEEDGTISLHCVRTVHAEQNAICQAAKRGVSINGATVYCKMTPCRTCAMLIINSGVKRVYCEKKYIASKESEKMFKKAKITISYKFNEVEKYPNQKG